MFTYWVQEAHKVQKAKNHMNIKTMTRWNWEHFLVFINILLWKAVECSSNWNIGRIQLEGNASRVLWCYSGYDLGIHVKRAKYEFIEKLSITSLRSPESHFSPVRNSHKGAFLKRERHEIVLIVLWQVAACLLTFAVSRISRAKTLYCWDREVSKRTFQEDRSLSNADYLLEFGKVRVQVKSNGRRTVNKKSATLVTALPILIDLFWISVVKVHIVVCCL